MTKPYITPAWSTVKPAHYYVYVHKRSSDGLVFYVGKGSGKRGWSRQGRNFLWWRVYDKHGATIEIKRQFKSEREAFRYESFLIEHYSRKGVFLTNLQKIAPDDLFYNERPSNKGINSCKKVFDFHHEDYGVVSCTRSELYNTYGISPSNLNLVISGDRLSVEGWTLYGKERGHKDHGKIYNFTHPVHGSISCTQSHLCKTYGLDHQSVSDICRGKCRSRGGWTLVGVSPGPRKNVVHKFYHEDHGFFLATPSEMAKMFGVRTTVFTRISGGHRETSLGWRHMGEAYDS